MYLGFVQHGIIIFTGSENHAYEDMPNLSFENKVLLIQICEFVCVVIIQNMNRISASLCNDLKGLKCCLMSFNCCP